MFCHHHEEWWRHPAGGHAESNGADSKYETSDARGIPEMSQTFTMHLEHFKFHCRYDGTRRDLVKCRKWLWLHCVWCGATWIKLTYVWWILYFTLRAMCLLCHGESQSPFTLQSSNNVPAHLLPMHCTNAIHVSFYQIPNPFCLQSLSCVSMKVRITFMLW